MDRMSNTERAWLEASLDWHEELGFALVQALEDEDDAMTAIQVVRKFCVPAPAYRGAVGDAEALAHAVSASLEHGERSPLAMALSAYLEKHPWTDL